MACKSKPVGRREQSDTTFAFGGPLQLVSHPLPPLPVHSAPFVDAHTFTRGGIVGNAHARRLRRRWAGLGCSPPPKKVGVIAAPVITAHLVRAQDEVLVGASDGVWSVLASAKVRRVATTRAHTSDSNATSLSRAKEKHTNRRVYSIFPVFLLRWSSIFLIIQR